jgi:hypothetical protein
MSDDPVVVKVDDAQVWERFNAFVETFPMAVSQGLWAWGELVLTEAVKRAPLQTGRLRKSAFQTPTRREGSGYAIYLGFGAKHAVEVHERTDRPHPVGEAKFLEHALQQLAPSLLRTVVETAERAVKAGKGNRVRTGRGKFPNSPPAEG